MRRKDREITDRNAIESFLSEEQILRVAFYDRGDIYIVPVNYGYVRKDGTDAFYFHGAKAGRKYELSKSEPMVGFEIDGKYRLVGGDAACDYTASFQSVIGTGTLHLVDTTEEKICGLNAIMRQTTGKAAWTYETHMLNEVAIFRLDAEKLSCKAK